MTYCRHTDVSRVANYAPNICVIYAISAPCDFLFKCAVTYLLTYYIVAIENRKLLLPFSAASRRRYLPL